VSVVTGDPLPAEYFDRLYAGRPDPWDFEGRWYERRKRDLTLASLPRQRYRRCFEPGCSVGLLTEALAARCATLLATDVTEPALAAARARLAGRPQAQVEQRRVPEEWPEGEFDLVVISEIAYYCDEPGASALGRAAARCLAPDGALVLCHWLHPVADYPLSGRQAQRLVREASGLATAVRHEEEDFLLEVLTRPGTPSVAAEEGLVDGS
jgi:SAM-dependent methyltransferase